MENLETRAIRPPQRILVVDDEPSITDLVATALRYEGFQVQTAATGRKALAAATSFRPHLAVLDIMLPDLDGFEVQGRLAADGIRQILDNLLSNAATHTTQGSAIHVRVRGDQDDASLQVEDEGPGIPEEDTERVFERFYRADPSRSRESGGSGLGLSIVAALAEAHGGSATCTRAPGGGARFEVRIPMMSEDTDPVGADATPITVAGESDA